MTDKVNGTETEVHEVAMDEQAVEQALEDAVEIIEDQILGDGHPQPNMMLDPEIADRVSARLNEYITKLKETEDNELVNMAVLNIQMENFRRTMIMGGAPAPIVAEFQNVIMKTSLDMIGFLINIEGLGTERFVELRKSIVDTGDAIAREEAEKAQG